MAGSNLFAQVAAQLKRGVIVRVIGLVVLVVAGGAFAILKGFSGGDAAKPVNAANATAHVSHARPNVAVASAKPVTAQVVPAGAKAGKNANHVVQNGAVHPASSDGNGAPVVSGVSNNASAGPVGGHLDDQLTYQYNAIGRRDPFQSLVEGDFVGADVGGEAPPDPGGIKVVGIVWGATDQFAMVEDVRGNSYVLRRGDKVQNGYVQELKRDGVIVNITAEGQSQSVVIPLVRKGDSNAR